MYGITREGTTTDVYSMIFRPDPPAATTVAAAQPVQPVMAQPVTPVQPGQQYQTAARPVQTATPPGRTGQPPTTASRAPQPGYAQPAPQPAPVQVAQQPAPPAPPPEPDVPTAYGITANGPSTDLYTMIFGPRNSSGQ